MHTKEWQEAPDTPQRRLRGPAPVATTTARSCYGCQTDTQGDPARVASKRRGVMTVRSLLLASTVFMYGGGVVLFHLQQAGRLPADNPVDLAPFPSTSASPASSGLASSPHIMANDATTSEIRVGDPPVDAWLYRASPKS